jgi:hypothetical protein
LAVVISCQLALSSAAEIGSQLHIRHLKSAGVRLLRTAYINRRQEVVSWSRSPVKKVSPNRIEFLRNQASFWLRPLRIILVTSSSESTM